MFTNSALSARAATLPDFDGVASRRQLRDVDVTARQVDVHVAAGRWRAVGLAVILHNGPVTLAQRRRICLINSGPHAVLTSFTAAEEWGLRRWERPEVHVAVPMGTELTKVRHPLLRGLVRHQVRHWDRMKISAARRLHELAPAIVLAASSFRSSRPGCGLLAASVQQRLLRPDDLRAALRAAPRARHRRHFFLAVADIEQGAEALSEIDFRRLCLRFGLPKPSHQAIRVGPDGRRRYLDVRWRLPDGRLIGVEVDGAYHTDVDQWFADQMRQNDVVLGGVPIIRYPSIVVRDAPEVVAEQLRRAFAANGKGLTPL